MTLAELIDRHHAAQPDRADPDPARPGRRPAGLPGAHLRELSRTDRAYVLRRLRDLLAGLAATALNTQKRPAGSGDPPGAPPRRGLPSSERRERIARCST